MKAWATFYDLTNPHLPGASTQSVDIALRNAAREFCRRAKVWRETHAAIPTVANTAVYGLTVTTEKVAAGIEYATCDLSPLRILTDSEAVPFNVLGPGTPGGILLVDASDVQLFPAPSTAGLSIIPYLVMMPGSTADGVTDQIFENYCEAIAAGAKSELMLSPKKPYSDAATGAAQRVIFEMAVARAALARTGRGRSRARSANRFI